MRALAAAKSGSVTTVTETGIVPKYQANKQALWAEERMRNAIDVKYFHVVFTLPEALNQVCLPGSKRF